MSAPPLVEGQQYDAFMSAAPLVEGQRYDASMSAAPLVEGQQYDASNAVTSSKHANIHSNPRIFGTVNTTSLRFIFILLFTMET